jgi:hypothetical protein
LKETYPFFTLVAFADNDHQSQHGIKALAQHLGQALEGVNHA